MRRPIPETGIGALLESSQGLTAADAARRLGQYGPNHILDAPTHPWRDLALDTARDPMLWFLLAAGGLYAAVGERGEALTLLLSLAPLVGMDAVLHRRTRASTEGLRTRLASQARVMRDGAERTLPVEEVVPGDLARVTPGEYFPADGILVAGEELQADESTLTGEAHPVRKRPLRLAANHPRPAGGVDSVHWGFAGTRLLTGEARLRVTLTGSDTLYGEITSSARRTSQTRTPLQNAIGQLVRVLLIAAALLCVGLAIVRLRQGFGWIDALVSAVTLAVAALPEEFPVVFTTFLGVGVYRLARRKALVRRAVSVENIGRVSCICTDKTGTITLGELQLTHRIAAPGATEEELLSVAGLASRRDGGDPLDVAIFHALDASGSVPLRCDVVDTFPFSEARRRETAVVRTSAGLLIATKGAPETVLALCQLAPAERGTWLQRASDLAAEGHKVIACASHRAAGAEEIEGEMDRAFHFVGLIALEDPVRDGVAEAITRCRAAGIRTVMVTGDHPATAAAVAREIGLVDGSPRVMTGEDLEAVLVGPSPIGLAGVDVIARAIPAQKLALVRAFQAAGELVAVTGDGVNDVPALQAADVGIAMGERATRSAREVAAIVLLDDNFRTIVQAIAEGRQLFRNLQQSFRYLLMIHIPLVVTAALIPLAGYPILYLPIHIVWLELVIHPSAMLAFQAQASRAGLERSQARPAHTFFSRTEWALIGLTGGLLVAVVTLGYHYSLGVDQDIPHARAMALLVLSSASAALVAILSGLRTRPAAWIFVLTFAFAAALIQTPSLAARLHVEPLHWDDWAIGLFGGFACCMPLLAAGFLARRAR